MSKVLNVATAFNEEFSRRVLNSIMRIAALYEAAIGCRLRETHQKHTGTESH